MAGVGGLWYFPGCGRGGVGDFSFFVIFAYVPAALVNCPPLPGPSSRLCTIAPAGMRPRGKELPIEISTLEPRSPS